MGTFYIHGYDCVEPIEADYDPLYGVVTTKTGWAYTINQRAWKTHQEAYDALLAKCQHDYNEARMRLVRVSGKAIDDILLTAGRTI